MGLSHPFDRYVGADTFCKIEPIIGWFESTGTRSLPFMGVTEAFAHNPAYEGSFAGAHPDDRVHAGDIRELELIDAGTGILGLFGSRMIERRHILSPANLLKFVVFISDGQLAELFMSPLRG